MFTRTTTVPNPQPHQGVRTQIAYLYTRAKEHMGDENRVGTEERESGFARKHMEQRHQGMESSFRAKVTKVNKDSMSRQVREGVMIRRSTREMLNSKSEWFQPPIYRIRSEVVRD